MAVKCCFPGSSESFSAPDDRDSSSLLAVEISGKPTVLGDGEDGGRLLSLGGNSAGSKPGRWNAKGEGETDFSMGCDVGKEAEGPGGNAGLRMEGICLSFSPFTGSFTEIEVEPAASLISAASLFRF